MTKIHFSVSALCCIFEQPIFGLLKVKLELITHAYVDERDFSKVGLLEQMSNNLNASLMETLLNESNIYLGEKMVVYCAQ